MSINMRLDLSGLHQNGDSDRKESQHDHPIITNLTNSINIRVNEDQLKLETQPLTLSSQHQVYPGRLFRTARPAVPVAVKCYSTSREDAAAFTREVQLLWNLHHPNIIKMWGWVDTSKSLMFAVDLAKCSLQELMKNSNQNRRLCAGSKLTIAAQVADALRYLHKRGMYHGKLLSAHVVVGTPDGFTKLISFSHSTTESTETSTASLASQNGATGKAACLDAGVLGANDDISSFGALLVQLFSVHDAPQLAPTLKSGREQAARPTATSSMPENKGMLAAARRGMENLRTNSLRSRTASNPAPVEVQSKPTPQPWIPLRIKRIASRCTDADPSKRMKMPEVLKALKAVPEQVESDIQALSASLRSGVQAELQQSLRQLHSYVLDGWCDPCIPLDLLLAPSTDAMPFTPRTARNIEPMGSSTSQPGTPFAARNCMWGRIMESVLSLACSSPAVPVVQACVSLLLCYTQACHQHCKALTHKGGLQALLHLLEAHSNGLVRATCLQATITVLQAWVQSETTLRSTDGVAEFPGSTQLNGGVMHADCNGLAGSDGGCSSEQHGHSNGRGSLLLQTSGSGTLSSNGASQCMQHSGSFSQGSAASGQLPPGGSQSNALSVSCGSAMGMDSMVGGDNGVLSPTSSVGYGSEAGTHGSWPASPLQELLPNMHWLVPMMQDLDAKVRNNACLLVRLLAASDGRTRAALVQYGAVSYLDALLQDPPVHQIHLNATAGLLLLTSSNSILGAISEAKATVPTLINLLKQTADREVSTQASGILAALARHGMGPAITAYEPALPTILQLVKQPFGNVDPRVLACLGEMLCGVASNTISAKVALVKAGLVTPLVVLLQHPNMNVVRQMAGALVRLAYDPPDVSQPSGDPNSPQPAGQYKPGKEIVDVGAVLACLYCSQYRSLVSLDDAAATIIQVITSTPPTTSSILPVAIDRLTHLAQSNNQSANSSWTVTVSPAIPSLLSQLKSAISQTTTSGPSAEVGLLCRCVQCLAVNPDLKGCIVGSPGVVGLLGSALHSIVKDFEKKVAGGMMQREGSRRLPPSPSPRPSPRDSPGGGWPEEDVAFDVVCCLWSLAWQSAKVQLELLDAGSHLDVLALLRHTRGRAVFHTACVFYLGCFITERSSRVRLKASSVEEALTGVAARQTHPKTAQLAKALIQAVKEGDNKHALQLMFPPLPNHVRQWMVGDDLLGS